MFHKLVGDAVSVMTHLSQLFPGDCTGQRIVKSILCGEDMDNSLLSCFFVLVVMRVVLVLQGWSGTVANIAEMRRER